MAGLSRAERALQVCTPRLPLLHSGRTAQDTRSQAGNPGQDAEDGRTEGTEVKSFQESYPPPTEGRALIEPFGWNLNNETYGYEKDCGSDRKRRQ